MNIYPFEICGMITIPPRQALRTRYPHDNDHAITASGGMPTFPSTICPQT